MIKIGLGIIAIGAIAVALFWAGLLCIFIYGLWESATMPNGMQRLDEEIAAREAAAREAAASESQARDAAEHEPGPTQSHGPGA